MISELEKIKKNIESKKLYYIKRQEYEKAATCREVEMYLIKIINVEELEFFMETFKSAYCRSIIFNYISKEIKPLFGILRKIKVEKIHNL